MTNTMRNRLREWSAQKGSNFPSANRFHEILAVVTDLRETENSLLHLNSRLEQSISGLRNTTLDEKQLADAVSYLYWNLPEVSSRWLSEVFLGSSNPKVLRKYLQPVKSGIECWRCRKEFEFATRDELHDAIAALKEAQRKESVPGRHLKIIAIISQRVLDYNSPLSPPFCWPVL
jgi:hypothetical protein